MQEFLQKLLTKWKRYVKILQKVSLFKISGKRNIPDESKAFLIRRKCPEFEQQRGM
jgi:hypothetical protein